MTSQLLLQHFARISDAPDAIPRLRRFILNLAIRGKLVAQDVTECVNNSIPEVIESGQSETAPPNWRSTRFGNIAEIAGGFAFKSGDYAQAGIFVLRVTNIEPSGEITKEDAVYFPTEKLTPEIERFYLNEGDILLVMVGGSLGKIGIVSGDLLPALLNQNLWRITPSNDQIDRRYLRLLIDFIVSFQRKVTHSTHGHLSREDFRRKCVYIPPLAEQYRIVAKVDELMALCDRLEAAQAERENQRNRLVASTHASLVAGEGTDAQPATFFINHLPQLTTRREHIQQLRQTILNLAVRGKLVPQDPNDEPATDLLRSIYIQRGTIKKERKEQELHDSNLSFEKGKQFEVPPSWIWARFEEIAEIRSNLVEPRDHLQAPHIAPDNIESKTGKLLDYVTIGESGVFSAKHLFNSGCILYSKIRPALAKVVIVDFDGLCSADMYPIFPLIHREYLHNYMLSESFVVQSIKEDTRVAMPKINRAALSIIAVPVPPLAEQHRIVAKVDELMALCDRLEEQLTFSETESHRLLESILHQSLAEPRIT